ncbi:MAG: sugar transferase [Clostridiales bacterium]|jgi:exopolysaccharide biosynthesis polyprenyl glycosylphosphotransferase|nr:sugar transferase [Clostridiales bacterium]
MKNSSKKPLHFWGIAEGCAVLLMMAAFIAGTYVEQYFWAMPDRVNFRQCLPWFIIFTVATMYFNSAFDLTRRMHHLAFSMFISIIMINVFMMALPFFEVLYYIQVTTLLIIITLECLCMALWILIFHRLWVRFNPPASTVVICEDEKRGWEIAGKINSRSFTNRVNTVCAYDEDKIHSVLNSHEAVVLVSAPLEKKNELALECWDLQKDLIIVPDVYELIVNNATLIQFDDIMAYKIKSIGLTLNQKIVKRAIDIAVSALGLIVLSPLMLVLALIVKRDGGPALYSQNRVTRDGRIFRLYKFRTMIPDAEKLTGPTLALKDDPRITKAGKKLRQTRLDELPQLWNVLIGDMSLVGPRPEREHFINMYLETLPEYQYREKVRAGITGLAHVMGKYNTTPEERIKLDLTYIQNYSLSLDIKIIIETLRVVLTKEYAEGVKSSKEAVKKDSRREETV